MGGLLARLAAAQAEAEVGRGALADADADLVALRGSADVCHASASREANDARRAARGREEVEALRRQLKAQTANADEAAAKAATRRTPSARG